MRCGRCYRALSDFLFLSLLLSLSLSFAPSSSHLGSIVVLRVRRHSQPTRAMLTSLVGRGEDGSGGGGGDPESVSALEARNVVTTTIAGGVAGMSYYLLSHPLDTCQACFMSQRYGSPLFPPVGIARWRLADALPRPRQPSDGLSPWENRCWANAAHAYAYPSRPPILIIFLALVRLSRRSFSNAMLISGLSVCKQCLRCRGTRTFSFSPPKLRRPASLSRLLASALSGTRASSTPGCGTAGGPSSGSGVGRG